MPPWSILAGSFKIGRLFKKLNLYPSCGTKTHPSILFFSFSLFLSSFSSRTRNVWQVVPISEMRQCLRQADFAFRPQVRIYFIIQTPVLFLSSLDCISVEPLASILVWHTGFRPLSTNIGCFNNLEIPPYCEELISSLKGCVSFASGLLQTLARVTLSENLEIQIGW